MLKETVIRRWTVEDIAEVAHEANRAYCVTLGDTSQLPWSETPDWQKRSIVAGVEAIQSNIELTPEEVHARWMDRKEREGWTFGEVKDTEKKTHPRMMSYKDLSAYHKINDNLFGAVVRALLPLLEG